MDERSINVLVNNLINDFMIVIFMNLA